jgi:hypothetical protein
MEEGGGEGGEGGGGEGGRYTPICDNRIHFSIKPEPAGACTYIDTFLKHFSYRGRVYSVQHLGFILMDDGYGHKVTIPQGREVPSLQALCFSGLVKSHCDRNPNLQSELNVYVYRSTAPVTVWEFTTSVTKLHGLFRLRMYLAEEMYCDRNG